MLSNKRLKVFGRGIAIVALLPVVVGFVAAFAGGYSDDRGGGVSLPPGPTATNAPTPTPPKATVAPTPTPTPPKATVAPTASPTPTPDSPGAAQGVIVGNPGVFSEPRHTSSVLRTLTEGQAVTIKATVKGEDWAYSTQNWPAGYQDWRSTWFELSDGGFVYRAFVYLPKSGDVQPWDVPEGERRVDVDTGAQMLTAYANGQPVRTVRITTGKPTTPTPFGSYTVWSRIESEVMASYDPADPYRVERVLFTQYFSGSGHALHLNYWQPAEVFGTTATSHGCVGLWIDDAQWLWLFGQAGMRVEIHSSFA